MKNVCVFCGGDIRQDVTRVIEEAGDEVIIVEGVPAGVCTQCGEREFDPDTVRRLEDIRAGARGSARQRVVPVVEFGGAVVGTT